MKNITIRTLLFWRKRINQLFLFILYYLYNMLFYINIFLINIINMDYSIKLLEFFDIEIIMIFIKTIKKYYHDKRKTKYSIEYYLYHIILVLKELSRFFILI